MVTLKRLSGLLFTPLLLGFGHFCFAQNPLLEKNNYKTFTGTIADMPVFMQWSNVNTDGEISYEYLKRHQPISLYYIADSSKSGVIFLSEGLDSNDKPSNRPVWKCRFSDGKLTGKWYSADRTKSYPILLQEKLPAGSQPFSYLSTDTTVYLFPDDTSTDFADEIELTVPVATAKDETANWLNEYIKRIAGFKPEMSIPSGILDWVDSQSAEFLSNKEEAQKYKDHAWSWTMINDITIAYNQNDFIQFSVSGYQFSGGAHGSSWQHYACVDVKNKKEIGLENIVSADSFQLERLLEAQFRKDYDLKPEDSLTEYLFENKIMPNDNFSFDGSGLTFTYGQYEIGPYVMGIISLKIPWADLAPYIVPEFAERTGIK